MADIFLSYRQKDSAILTEMLAALFRKAGWTVWHDSALNVGNEVSSVIEAELNAARCVVGAWSRNAGVSPHVRHEFETASEQGKLLAFVTDDAEIPPQYHTHIVGDLRGLHRLSYGAGMPRLLRGIVDLIGLPSQWPDVEALIAGTLDPDFNFFKLGDITIPAKWMVGTTSAPYGPADVEIADRDEVHEQQADYPAEITAVYPEILAATFKAFDQNPKKLRDNPLPRLDRWEREPEGPHDERGRLKLTFSRTSYFQIWGTNVALDVPFFSKLLRRETTLRESFCSAPYEALERSVLANNPGVEVALISRSPEQDPPLQLIIRQRSDASGYRGWFQSSASGHLGLGHVDMNGAPSPFVTAIAETVQEVSEYLKLTPEDYRLLGLVLKEQDLHPSFAGYIETSRPSALLVADSCRDSYEGKKSAIAFTPEAVLDHIVRNRWFPLSALTLIQTLITYHGIEAVEAVAKRVGLKRVQDFRLEVNLLGDER